MQVSGQGSADLGAPPPLRAEWRERLAAHLTRLSPESRLGRFFVWMSDAALVRHADRTAPAVIVEARVAGDARGMAEVHLRTGPRILAEISLSVEDGWQRRGLGTALVDQAVREARRRGAEEVVIYFLPGNAAMRKITDRLGFVRSPGGDATVVEARIPAPETGSGARRFS